MVNRAKPPRYAVRNIDDSIITWASIRAEAERIAAEVRRGDFDGIERECWISVEEQ